MANSTALMSADLNGFEPMHHWGYATLDWQCDAKSWLGATAKGCTCEATSAANCRELKRKGLVKRCGICERQPPPQR